MGRIANINGKDVYSDKAVNSIVNSRVNFTDGSWLDVATGEMVNTGPGYIRLGGQPGAAAGPAITQGPTRYKAQPLCIANVVADVHILVGDTMEVAITGPESEVKRIRIREDHRLHIEGERTRSSGNAFVQTRRGSVVMGNNAGNNIIITGQVGSVSGGGRAQESATKIMVTVPTDTPIELTAIIGKTDIGDTDGPLQVFAQGGDVEAGRVKNAHLSIQGGGDIRVKEINGTLDAQVQGSGDIRVNGGKISTLIATVQGSGDIRCRVRAYSASLAVQGSGDISIDHVETKPIIRKMGSGDINVGNW